MAQEKMISNKTIEFSWEDERGVKKDYVLEFTRKSVEKAEKMGFVVEDLDNKPVSTFPLFFYTAFIEHHPFVKRAQTDEIYFAMKNRNELISALVEMYRDTLESLVEDSEEKESKNVEWTKNW